MLTTKEYLNEAKRRLGLPSDRQLAKWMGITTSALSQYQTGNRVIDDYAAAKIAEALDIPAIEVIAVANLEREKDEKRRKFWENFSRGTAAAVLFLLTSRIGGEMNSITYKRLVINNNIHYAQLQPQL